MRWTDESVQLLIELWKAGHSAEVISRKLVGGMSRSAVLGKANRLGLSRPPTREPVAVLAARAPVRRMPLPLPLPTAEDVPRKPLADLEPGDCRWPVTVAVGTLDERHMFCAEPAAIGTSYCAAHLRRAHAGAVQASVPVRAKNVIRFEAAGHAGVSEFLGDA